MRWLELVPVVVAGILLVGLPGAAVGYLLRLRGLWLTALAAPISVSLIAVAALVSPWVGLSWGLAPLVGLSLLAAACAAAWSRWMPGAIDGRGARYRGRRFALLLGLVIPATIIAFVLYRSIGDPTYISQQYDNFFHLNAVQFVLDTGNASPLWIGNMTSPGGLPFYPSGWHATVSLLVVTSGASVPVATNALIFITAALVWPLGAVLMSRTLLGSSPVLLVGAGVVSASLPAFPFLPLHYGVLYPLFLGLACVPAALSAAFMLLRPTRTPRVWRHYALLVVLIVPGVGVAHPGALLAFLALSIPFVMAFVISHLRASERRVIKWAWAAGLVAYFALGVLALQIVRPPASQIYWPVIGSLPQAIGEVLGAAVYGYPLAGAVAILNVIGACAVIKRPSYGRIVAIGMAVIGGVLYVIVAGSTSETLRLWLTGPWYNNSPRLAAIWAIGTLPLAALGLLALVRFVGQLGGITRVAAWTRAHYRVPLVVMAVALVAVTQGDAIRQAAADIEYTYKLREGGPILTPDEYALMMRIPELVSDDAVIAGNPWTGASFAYGISGVPVLMPHLLMDETASAHVINTLLDSDADSAAVCAALDETGVRYVLDFGDEEFMENDGDYSGLDQISDSPWVELVASEGTARLYEVTSCGL